MQLSLTSYLHLVCYNQQLFCLYIHPLEKIITTQYHLSKSKTASGQFNPRTKSADIDHPVRPNLGDRDQLHWVLNLAMRPGEVVVVVVVSYLAYVTFLRRSGHDMHKKITVNMIILYVQYSNPIILYVRYNISYVQDRKESIRRYSKHRHLGARVHVVFWLSRSIWAGVLG